MSAVQEQMGPTADAATDEGARSWRADASKVRAYQELWFALARRAWTSIVLVPVDPGGSAAEIGSSLAEIGTRLNDVPVRAISVSSLKYESAFALADLQQQLRRGREDATSPAPSVNVTGTVVATREMQSAEYPVENGGALVLAAQARLIIAVPAVLTDPLGIGATHDADAVVLTMEMGRTRMADARRTIELIGRERIAGCFLVR